MFYEGFSSGDRIMVIPTYRCQMDPILNSSIRDLNNPGANYVPKEPILGTVDSETFNGIWIVAEIPIYEDYKKSEKYNLVRDFYKKDQYMFELIKTDRLGLFIDSIK